MNIDQWMERVFDLLDHFIPFIIVILAGIFSFIKKWFQDSTANERSKTGTLREKRKKSPTRHPNYKIKQKTKTIDHHAHIHDEVSMITNADHDPHRASLKKEALEATGIGEMRERYTDRSEEILVPSIQIDPKNVREAIIWAEIVGKPKAYRKNK
ncbi:hypothetical protein [Fictibacillus gelatini]|uniref:hypothetical protein n=1 Tax=Fictibacillus gelatini TaxID=225985 RepID=UPI000423387E|nr:hypothetical protein [Fictibacillus gelatini]